MGSQNSVPEQDELSPSPKPSSARRNRLKKPPTNTSLESPSSRPVFPSARRRPSPLESSPTPRDHESAQTAPPTETNTTCVDLATPTRSPPPTTIIEEIAETALSAGSPSSVASGRVLRRRSLLVAAPPGTVTRRGTQLSRHSLPAPTLAVETTATRCITPSGYSVIGPFKRGSLRITNGAASPAPSSAPGSPKIPPADILVQHSIKSTAYHPETLHGTWQEVTRNSSQGNLPPLHLNGTYGQPHDDTQVPQYADVVSEPLPHTAPPPPPMRTPPPIPSFGARIPPTTPPTIRHVHDDALDVLEGRRTTMAQSVECTITPSRFNPIITPRHAINTSSWSTAQQEDIFSVQQTVFPAPVEKRGNVVVQADYSVAAKRFMARGRRPEQWPPLSDHSEEVLNDSKITGQEYYRRFSKRRSQQTIHHGW